MAAIAYAVLAGACVFGSSGASPPPPADASRTARVGLVVATNSPSFRRLLSVRETRGVIVLFVQPDGPGDRAGVSAGDVITAVDGKDMPNAEVGVVALRGHLGETKNLDVVRRDGTKKKIAVHARVPGPVDLRTLYTPRIDQNPNDPLLRYLRAQADDPIGDFNKLIADLGEAIKADSQFAEARILRAEREWNMSEQRTLKPAQRVDLERRALNDWTQGLKIDKSNTRGLSSIAQAIAISQPAAGIRTSKKALELDKRLPSAYYALGLGKLVSRGYADAAKAARSAIDLDPFDLRYYELLATSFKRLKRTGDCEKTLQSVFTLFNDSREKARLLTICS